MIYLIRHKSNYANLQKLSQTLELSLSGNRGLENADTTEPECCERGDRGQNVEISELLNVVAGQY